MDVQISEACTELQTAVNESHPAPPAKWLRQAAAACLHYGLQASQSGLQLNPVDCNMVVGDVRAVCPDIDDLMQKLHSKTGSKYLSIVKSSHQPDAVLVNLLALIMPHKQVQVSETLSCIASPKDNNNQQVAAQISR